MPYDSDGIEVPCTFCDDPSCDGSGYNCEDGRYQEYNLRGWPEDTTPEASTAPDGDEDDRWQEFKDDVAMGHIDRDGRQLEPPEPDWAERGGDR